MTAVLEAPSRGPRVGLLAMRDFRLLWTGETTSTFGSSISAVAVPLVALTELHAGVFVISMLSAAAWLPWLLVGLPAGAWVDRLPRRRIMMAADLVSLAVIASVPVAAALGLLSVAQLLIVALIAGTATVFFATAYRAFLPSLLAPAQLLEGNAKLQGSAQVANIAGPGTAGLIAQAVTAAGGVAADAASFGVSLFCLARTRDSERGPGQRRPAPEQAARRRLRAEIADGLRLVFGDPLLRVNAVYGCLSNLLLTGYQSVLIVFLVRDVGLRPG
jgi:MFS family permease